MVNPYEAPNAESSKSRMTFLTSLVTAVGLLFTAASCLFIGCDADLRSGNKSDEHLGIVRSDFFAWATLAMFVAGILALALCRCLQGIVRK